MGRTGDSFSGTSGINRTLVNPNEPTFSEQIIYLLRTLTGLDTPDKDQFVLATKSKAIGSISDPPAVPTNLTQASLIALSKALVLLSLGIEQQIITMAAAIDADFAAVNTNLAGLGLELAGLRGDMIARLDLILAGINDILAALERSSTGLEAEGMGGVTTAIVGPISWLSWDCDDPAAACVLTVWLGGSVAMRSFAPGQFYSYPKPLVCDSAIVTCSNPAASVTISYGA